MTNIKKKNLAKNAMFGALRLVSRISYPSKLRLDKEIDAGKWLCRCVCGTLVEVRTDVLRTGFLSGRCCGNPECDPAPRKKGRRPGTLPAAAQFGRLIVTRRVPQTILEGKKKPGGWMAECAFCLVELGPFRDTWKMRRAGKRECRYPCAASGAAGLLRADEALEARAAR